jgi:hypothetical protein
MACMQVVAEPPVRGTLVAIMVFATSLISYGAAPALIGVISDLLIDKGFDEASGGSLRVALLSALVLPLLACVTFVYASRSATQEAVN